MHALRTQRVVWVFHARHASGVHAEAPTRRLRCRWPIKPNDPELTPTQGPQHRLAFRIRKPLRVGAAQSLAENDVSLPEVQRAGGWKSPSMPGYYVRNQEASRGAVARLRGRSGQSAAKKLPKTLAILETAVLTSINES